MATTFLTMSSPDGSHYDSEASLSDDYHCDSKQLDMNSVISKSHKSNHPLYTQSTVSPPAPLEKVAFFIGGSEASDDDEDDDDDDAHENDVDSRSPVHCKSVTHVRPLNLSRPPMQPYALAVHHRNAPPPAWVEQYHCQPQSHVAISQAPAPTRFDIIFEQTEITEESDDVFMDDCEFQFSSESSMEPLPMREDHSLAVGARIKEEMAAIKRQQQHTNRSRSCAAKLPASMPAATHKLNHNTNDIETEPLHNEIDYEEEFLYYHAAIEVSLDVNAECASMWKRFLLRSVSTVGSYIWDSLRL